MRPKRMLRRERKVGDRRTVSLCCGAVLLLGQLGFISWVPEYAKGLGMA